MIYFARLADGPIKIGFSSHVDRRMLELAALHGCKVQLLGMTDGDRAREAELHQTFSHLRLGRTEQFLPAAELFDFIGAEAPDEAVDRNMKPVLLKGNKVIITIELSAQYHHQIKLAALMAGKPVGAWLEDLCMEHVPKFQIGGVDDQST